MSKCRFNKDSICQNFGFKVKKYQKKSVNILGFQANIFQNSGFKVKILVLRSKFVPKCLNFSLTRSTFVKNVWF